LSHGSIYVQKMNKKVLFIITKSNWGGAQRYVYDMARSLSSKGFYSQVAAGTYFGKGGLNEKILRLGIPFIEIKDLKRDVDVFSSTLSLFNPIAWIRSIVHETGTLLFFISLLNKEKPEILHLNSPKAGGLGAVAGKIVGIKKIIYTAHGWAFFEGRPQIQKVFLRLLSWLTIVLVDQTIAVSVRDRDAFTQWPFIKNKITLVHNGISIDKKPHKIRTPTQSIGTVAELHKNKGLDCLIRALTHTPSLELRIVGNGDERRHLEEMAEKLGVSKRVYFLGFISPVHTELEKLEIFILPSRKEGLPYVLLEAGLAKAPVVATAVGGIPEIIEHEKTGLLVPPENPEALASAITRLHNDTALQRKLSENLYKKVTEQFSIEQMVQKTVALYND